MDKISNQAKEDIKNAYHLYETFEKNEKAISGGKFTNLFLAHVGSGDNFEFVKRYSLVGACKRLWAWITRAQTFNFNTNFDLVNKLYQKIYSECNIEDTSQLNEVAKELGIQGTDKENPGDILRKNLLKVGYYLNNVESSRFVKRTENKEAVAAAAFVKRAIPLYEKRVQSAFETFTTEHSRANVDVFTLIDQKLGSANLGLEERNAVAFCIATSTEKDDILGDLQAGKKERLLVALRELLPVSLAPAMHAALRGALNKIAPPETLVAEKFTAFMGSRYSRAPEQTSLQESKEIVDSFLQTEPVQVADNMLTITASTTPADLQAKVTALQDGQTCRFLGGAIGHPMVISIEKTGDNYTLKFFQQEADKLMPSELKGPADKTKGYLEYKEVKTQPLLQPTPIGWLGSIWSTAKPTLLEAFVQLRDKTADDINTFFEQNITSQLPSPQQGNDL